MTYIKFEYQRFSGIATNKIGGKRNKFFDAFYIYRLWKIERTPRAPVSHATYYAPIRFSWHNDAAFVNIYIEVRSIQPRRWSRGLINWCSGWHNERTDGGGDDDGARSIHTKFLRWREGADGCALRRRNVKRFLLILFSLILSIHPIGVQ